MITHDYLPGTKINIIQDDEMFRINTDTEVLGQFLEVYRHDLVYDFGCNNGALMLYASLFNPKKIVGIDINAKALELAKQNLDNNGITNYELIHADIKELKIEQADVIICNPPYFETEKTNLPENDSKKLAKHEYMLDLDSLICSIARNLKDNGTLYFLFLTSRIEEVFLILNKYNLHAKVLQFVHDKRKDFSQIFMIKAKKNVKSGLKVLSPRVI